MEGEQRRPLGRGGLGQPGSRKLAHYLHIHRGAAVCPTLPQHWGGHSERGGWNPCCHTASTNDLCIQHVDR